MKWQCFSKIHRLFYRNLNIKHEETPFELFVRGAQESPESTKAIEFALVCLPEMKYVTIAKKTVYFMHRP